MFDPIGKIPDHRFSLPRVRLKDAVKRRPIGWLGCCALLGYSTVKAATHLSALDPVGVFFSLTGVGVSLYLLNRIAEGVAREKRWEEIKKVAEELGG